LKNLKRFRVDHPRVKIKNPVEELPSTLPEDMRRALEIGYAQGQKNLQMFREDIIPRVHLLAPLQNTFPSYSYYPHLILYAMFLHGLNLALGTDIRQESHTYKMNAGRIGSTTLLYLTEFYRGLPVKYSRLLSKDLYPETPMGNQRFWELFCQGALGVALLIQMLNHEGLEIYHPRPYEDTLLKIDLFAIHPSEEYGFCLQIKTRKNGKIQVVIESPQNENSFHDKLLQGVIRFSEFYPNTQWIPLFMTLTIPDLAIDLHARHEDIENLIHNVLQTYEVSDEDL